MVSNASGFATSDNATVVAVSPIPVYRATVRNAPHGAIGAAVFARPAINGKGQCDAGHHDAASGRFLPENIAIPD